MYKSKSRNPGISFIISSSSLDSEFLTAQLHQFDLLDQILREYQIPVTFIYCIGSHLFDGTPENIPLPLKSRTSNYYQYHQGHSNFSLVLDNYNDSNFMKSSMGSHHYIVSRYSVDCERAASQPRYYHNMARLSGIEALIKHHYENSTTTTNSNNNNKLTDDDVMIPCNNWIVFLDGDEILQGTQFARWFVMQCALNNYLKIGMGYKFACYWYFHKSSWRARTWEDSIVMVHAHSLIDTRNTPYQIHERGLVMLRDPRERDGILAYQPNGALRMLVDCDTGLPMFHHFSWVRANFNQILSKIRTWGHKHDRTDWEDVIKETWMTISSKPELLPTPLLSSFRDPIHQYEYDILAEAPLPFL